MFYAVRELLAFPAGEEFAFAAHRDSIARESARWKNEPFASMLLMPIVMIVRIRGASCFPYRLIQRRGCTPGHE